MADSLNQLIERLQQLHLEQERILQALEEIAAVDQESNPAVAENPATCFRRVSEQ